MACASAVKALRPSICWPKETKSKREENTGGGLESCGAGTPIMTKTLEYRVEAAPDLAYEALKQTVLARGYHVQQADGQSKTLQFQAKRNSIAPRVNMNAAVLQGETATDSQVTFTGKPASGQLTWGELRNVAHVVFNGIRAVLPTLQGDEPAAPPTPPTPLAAPPTPPAPTLATPVIEQTGSSGDSLAADLERIVALHQSGALDDEEFKLAKAHLLRALDASSENAPLSAPFTAAAVPAPSAEPAQLRRGGVVAPLAAGVAGGMLMSNLVQPGNASASTTEPVSEHITYHETMTGPDGETATLDGTLDTQTTFDQNGDALVEVHDTGSMNLDGDTYDYDTNIEGDVDLGGDAGGDDGGILGLLGDLFS
jgi:hypothetical protein